MSSINIVFRPSVKAGRHQGSLSLRVIVNRKPKTVAVGCYLYPEEWDSSRQVINYPPDDPGRAAYLEAVEEKLSAAVGKMKGVICSLGQQGGFTTAESVFRYRLSPDNGMVSGFAAALSAELKRKGQKRLANAYLTVARRLTGFNKGMEVPLVNINADLVKAFETYLKDDGRMPNTTSYYMRNLRAIYNKAVRAGRIPQGRENPFANVFTGVEETRKRALSADEVNRLRSVDFDELLKEHEPGTREYICLQNLFMAQRLFIFCLYAQGMCFIDLCHLKKENIKDGMIRYYRKKTGKKIEVPMNEGIRKLIDSFAAEMAGSQYLFPMLKDAGSNLYLPYETALRAQNDRLKQLAVLAGLNKGISTHVARHSWASILKNKKQPLSVISEGLGHTSEKMTRKYLDSFEASVLGEAGRMLLSAVTKPTIRLHISDRT